jgi:hypothetical protein
MATSAKKLEELGRVRSRIESTTLDSLAESFAAHREFGVNYGYRDAADWWDTQVRSYPELFKADDAPVRPAWAASTVPTAPVVAFVAPSDKQLAFVQKLLSERDIVPAIPLAELNKREVSKLIDELLKLPKVARKPVAAPVELEDGMYLKDGEIFKVQHSRSSARQYAKQLRVVLEAEFDDEDDIVRPGEIVFDYIPGAIRKLTAADRMTLEQAEEFGALYGTCVRCGRTLTKEKSIARAMGPICAGKL